MNVVNWLHIWCGEGSHWRKPVEEHLQALARARFDGRFKVGIVGPPDQRAQVLDMIVPQRRPAVVKQFDDGWEQRTLRHVRSDARRNPNKITLYCHTKGASDDSVLRDAWRRSMTCALLARLPQNLRMLDTVEAVGCHWVDLPPGGQGFGGNFWLARNSFLAALPPLYVEHRFQAESWIGSGERPPVIRDLNPGWPGQVPWVHEIGWPR